MQSNPRADSPEIDAASQPSSQNARASELSICTCKFLSIYLQYGGKGLGTNLQRKNMLVGILEGRALRV